MSASTSSPPPPAHAHCTRPVLLHTSARLLHVHAGLHSSTARPPLARIAVVGQTARVWSCVFHVRGGYLNLLLGSPTATAAAGLARGWVPWQRLCATWCVWAGLQSRWGGAQHGAGQARWVGGRPPPSRTLQPCDRAATGGVQQRGAPARAVQVSVVLLTPPPPPPLPPLSPLRHRPSACGTTCCAVLTGGRACFGGSLATTRRYVQAPACA